MAKKKLTRKELLKSPDEFLTLSNRAFNFFNAHTRELKYAGVAVGVILVAYLAVYGYMRHINNSGQEAYNMAYSILSEGNESDPSPEKLKEAEELFKKVVDDYGMSKAARLALPQIGHVKFVEEKYDEALPFYRRFAEEVSGEKAYETLSSLALAACHEAKGDLKKAILILNSIVDDQGNMFRETAMVSLERVLRIDNQPGKADEVARKFVQEYKSSPFLPMIKARL